PRRAPVVIHRLHPSSPLRPSSLLAFALLPTLAERAAARRGRQVAVLRPETERREGYASDAAALLRQPPQPAHQPPHRGEQLRALSHRRVSAHRSALGRAPRAGLFA